MLALVRGVRTFPAQFSFTHCDCQFSISVFVVSRPTKMFRLARQVRPSRVRFASTSTQQRAQESLTKALECAKKTLTPVGDRVGVLLGSYRQPLLYNLSVSRELLKQIYIAENLAPPRSLSTVLDAYSTLWARVRDTGYWRTIFSNGEWARVGVYAVEAYGIFKIGEILGRRSLVGYDLH